MGQRAAAHSLEVFNCERELREHILVRYRLVVLQPLACLRCGALFLIADLFVLKRHVSDRRRARGEHGLKQTPDSAELSRRQAVEIRVSLTAFQSNIESHSLPIIPKCGYHKQNAPVPTERITGQHSVAAPSRLPAPRPTVVRQSA